MALVLGVGVGLFVLIFLWVLGIIGCVALSRATGGLKNAVFGIGVLLIIITVIMLLYPRNTKQEELAGNTARKVEVDTMIIPRTVLFSFSCIFAVVAFVFLLIFHWMDPIYSPAFSSRKTYSF
ncbi:transmembrane protein 218 [Exaiptasia diaphana]|uniref:Transmembrane protein 218 n=1 Tax=Exaiptasia diaphana TaxID=2652724 RepID=A0A913XQJ1_EXADI|nr:transmembrane protein 218 [Exaiptasia diaphana]KXJ25226.1 Transmembrane protein 218 [Exaiptasia diaphana]